MLSIEQVFLQNTEQKTIVLGQTMLNSYVTIIFKIANFGLFQPICSCIRFIIFYEPKSQFTKIFFNLKKVLNNSSTFFMINDIQESPGRGARGHRAGSLTTASHPTTRPDKNNFLKNIRSFSKTLEFFLTLYKR